MNAVSEIWQNFNKGMLSVVTWTIFAISQINPYDRKDCKMVDHLGTKNPLDQTKKDLG